MPTIVGPAQSDRFCLIIGYILSIFDIFGCNYVEVTTTVEYLHDNFSLICKYLIDSFVIEEIASIGRQMGELFSYQQNSSTQHYICRDRQIVVSLKT